MRTRKEATAKNFGSWKADGPVIKDLMDPRKRTANVAARKANNHCSLYPRIPQKLKNQQHQVLLEIRIKVATKIKVG